MPDMGGPARVDSLLMELATQSATGCLTLTDRDGEHAVVWFRDGLVYAVSVPGRRPLLGVRLMSSGALTPEGLAEALEVQRTELQGWRLGELLVHLNFVDRAVVESFVAEQVRDQVADLRHWRIVDSRFANGKRTRQDIAPPMEVVDLVGGAQERDDRWTEILPFIGGPDAVPVLSTNPNPANDVVLGPYDWALLCKVDGVRTIADLADDCGFTVFEAGMTVLGLLDAGLVDVESGGAVAPATEWDEALPQDDEVSASVARVAAALADMGMAPRENPTLHDLPAPTGSPFAAVDLVEPETPALAAVVSLDVERQAREDAAASEAERAEAERLEQERIAAEKAEQERLEAERLEAERLEAERLEAERLEAEEAARAEKERLEAERLAAEEAERAEQERLAAEEAEKERVEAERIEAERVAAERLAAVEAERLAAEEAERAEKERLAAE